MGKVGIGLNLEAVRTSHKSFEQGVAFAADVIDSGKALATLNKFIEISNRPEETSDYS